VLQLVSMGFGENGCRKAAKATGNDVEAAMNWVMSHMEDADFNDPPTAPGGGATAAANQESVMMLCSMGFTDAHAEAALGQTGGDMERAADWLFSHADDLDGAVASLASGAAAAGGGGGGGGASAVAEDDGPSTYTLRAMVSHIGKNTGSGHYVCHARKAVDGVEKWVIFNDSNVALSANPPREHAYLYLYQRTV